MASADIADPSPTLESAYVVRGEVSAEAITRSLQALLSARHCPIARQRHTVLDTFDGRVRRAGARLTRGGVNGRTTMAWQPRGGGGHLAVRLEQPVGFAWDFPHGPFRQAVARVVGPRRLLALADREQAGSLLEVVDDRGKTVARLRIESSRVRLPQSRDAWQPLPTVVTLTVLRGYEDVFTRLVPVIESRPGLEPCPGGLDGLTLRQLVLSERGNVSLPRVDLASSVRADVGAREIHRALLGILVANEPGLRANLDTEFLHDFRVAVRRTRSLLGQIREVFPSDVTAHFATGFSWLGGVTGPLRDLDVLVLALNEDRGDDPTGDLEAVMGFLRQSQQQEHNRLVEALDGERYQRLLSEWEAFLERPTPDEQAPGNAGRTLSEVVSRRAWRLSRRIARSAGTITEHAEAPRLHEVRIAAKKLRYLIDVTPAFYAATDLERILSALKKLQRVLGDFNDAHLQAERLLECGRALSATGGSERASLACGRLAEQSQQRRDRLRGQIVDGLARFQSHGTRSACRRAFKSAASAERAR